MRNPLTKAATQLTKSGVEFVGYIGITATTMPWPEQSFDLTGELQGGSSTSIQDGDLIVIMYVSTGTANYNLSIKSSGWTALGGNKYQNASYNDWTSIAGYRFVSGTPPSSVTIGYTSISSVGNGFMAMVFRNVDSLDTAFAWANGYSASCNPPSITTVTDGALVLQVGGIHSRTDAPVVITGASATPTGAENFNKIAYGTFHTPPAYPGQLCMFTLLKETAGTVDFSNLPISGYNDNGDSWGSLVLALRPG